MQRLVTISLFTALCGAAPPRILPIEEHRAPVVSRPLRPLAVTWPAAVSGPAPAARPGLFAKPVAMKLLLLGGDGAEASFVAIKLFLDYAGIPYDAITTATQKMPDLNDASRGFYQGIILSTGQLAYYDGSAWKSGLNTADWARLDAYARDYAVRTVSYYTYPEARYGMTFKDGIATTADAPEAITFAPDAKAALRGVNTANSLALAKAYAYLATPVAAAGESTKTLLTIRGATAGVLHTKADGREYLALTMDQNAALLHTLAMWGGLVNWVTKGVHFGERKLYLTPQADDLFLGNRLFVSSIEACRPTEFVVDQSTGPITQCPIIRLTGEDLRRLRDWQDGVNQQDQTKDFRVTMAFNGYGTSRQGGSPADDTLLAEALASPNAFYWVNHTWDHKNLDCYQTPPAVPCRGASAAESAIEIGANIDFAASAGLPIDPASIVTPGISGLRNPEFLQTASALGVRYLISDASRPEWVPAVPNDGLRGPDQPDLLFVARRAPSLFFNASSAGEGSDGSETDEYNYFYGPSGIFHVAGTGTPFFDAPQSYDQILDKESGYLLTYMLRGELYPQMYHQSNFWRYDGERRLFTDLHELAFRKLSQVSALPVVSLPLSEIGRRMEDRMAFRAAGVSGTIQPDNTIVLTGQMARAVITGVCAGACESYGGQPVSRVTMPAAGPLVAAAQ